MDRGSEPERRRSPRGSTKLWIAVDGVDAELRLRSGNVSATGVFFEHERLVGEPGTVQWLYLSSADRIVSLQIMACVVRTVPLSSAKGPHSFPLDGIAFEFMPESDEAVVQLRDFLHYVLALAADDIRAHDARSIAKSAGVRSIVLEADWTLPIGAPVRVEIIARGISRTTRVEGRVVKVAPSDTTSRDVTDAMHRLEIAVQRELEGPLRRFSSSTMQAVKVKDRVEGPMRRFTPSHGIPFSLEDSDVDLSARDESPNDAIDGLIATLLDVRSQPKPEPRTHLSGELERIRVPTLLSMFEMERMTGELAMQRGEEGRTVYVREGCVLDVQPTTGVSARDELKRLVSWDEGRFSFWLTPVDRPDRIATSTTALLLDFARELDESKHH